MIAIEISNLCKSYGRKTVLHDINLSIYQNEWLAVVGHNGAGKSTLIKIIATIIHPEAGDVIVSGLNVRTQIKQIRRLIGFVNQQISIDPTLTIQQNIVFAASLYGINQLEIMPLLKHFLTHLHLRPDVKVGQLSGGNQRLVDIIRALIHQPKILIMDEATNGLDVYNRERVWQFISELNYRQPITIISSSHYQEEVEHCSRVIALEEGHLVNHDLPMAEVQSWLAESTS